MTTVAQLLVALGFDLHADHDQNVREALQELLALGRTREARRLVHRQAPPDRKVESVSLAQDVRDDATDAMLDSMADLFVDGGSRRHGLPASLHGAAAWRIVGARGVVIEEGVRYAPGANAQEAELLASLYGLERCAALGLRHLSVYTDCGGTHHALTSPRSFRTGTPGCVSAAAKIRSVLKRGESLVWAVHHVTRRHHGIIPCDRMCDTLLSLTQGDWPIQRYDAIMGRKEKIEQVA